MRATRAIISLDNLAYNIKLVQEHLKGQNTPLICMPVKADAYGHGAVEIARAALKNGVYCLAVATVDEGIELRNAALQCPILVLSQCIPQEMEAAVHANLSPLVADIEAAELLSSAAQKAGIKKCSVYLKVDTGMGRMGCKPNEAADIAAYITGMDKLDLAGIITHLSVSDSCEANDIEYTNKQCERFTLAVNEIKKRSINPGIVSAAATGATVAHPALWFDMVRPGILLYGYAPLNLQPRIAVKPLMELVSKIVCIKKVSAGESISYGRTWVAKNDTTIGIVPAGYGDGLPRSLSGNFNITINGNPYPVIGRICMDQFMVDISGTNIQRWTDVSILGGCGVNSAASIATRTGTIPYEIICGINKRVPRIFL
jgi:alanine racemase